MRQFAVPRPCSRYTAQWSTPLSANLARVEKSATPTHNEQIGLKERQLGRTKSGVKLVDMADASRDQYQGGVDTDSRLRAIVVKMQAVFRNASKELTNFGR
uniref:Uncharacterized protein n=1 Tax=Physcomitrium patens TaxID=3218 RepID=A0A2K1KWI6_PHYPA|nr:hypothetical protein PHYPA_005147 [Physcomitrium patens]